MKKREGWGDQVSCDAMDLLCNFHETSNINDSFLWKIHKLLVPENPVFTVRLTCSFENIRHNSNDM